MKAAFVRSTGHFVAIPILVGSLLAPGAAVQAKEKDVVPFEESRIFIEYNSTDNDLGFHVALDVEDWKEVRIFNPKGRMIADLEGRAGYRRLGLSELFFEGAEPTLSEFPLADLLALFPQGTYRFEGRTVDGEKIKGESVLTHAVPAGPDVTASDHAVGPGNALTIRWNPVTTHAIDPAGGVFPNLPIDVVAYQVIVAETFQVTLPATDPPAPMSLKIPPEFVASLEPGENGFEVLAIDKSGNQTITAGAFTK
jgi:hypothetical protein